MFVNRSGRNVQSYNSGPSIDASYQDSVHLAIRFRGAEFKKSANQKQELILSMLSFKHFLISVGMFEINVYRNKNRLWWPCLLTDQDGMSNLYRGPSIDASYQV